MIFKQMSNEDRKRFYQQQKSHFTCPISGQRNDELQYVLNNSHELFLDHTLKMRL